MTRLKTLLISLVFLATAPALAQGDVCSALVQTVIDTVGDICADTSRNQACYGNIAMRAIPRADVADFQFSSVGDIEDVARIQTIQLSPLNAEYDAWGVAMMKLQANLPDTLPGQNVTFLMFGDVEIADALAAEDAARVNPMQAIYLRTGIGDAGCANAPQSGLLVQSPEGVGQVTFSVNGVDVSIGSTILFQAQAGNRMRVTALDGVATLKYKGNLYPVIAGTHSDVFLDRDYHPIAPPLPPEAYSLDAISTLPISLLEHDIDLVQPLSRQALDEFHNRLANDEPVCGVAPFPSCDSLTVLLGGTGCPLALDGVTQDCERSFLFEWDRANVTSEPVFAAAGAQVTWDAFFDTPQTANETTILPSQITQSTTSIAGQTLNPLQLPDGGEASPPINDPGALVPPPPENLLEPVSTGL